MEENKTETTQFPQQQVQPTAEQIKEAQNDPSKRVVEGKDGLTHITERMRG